MSSLSAYDFLLETVEHGITNSVRKEVFEPAHTFFNTTSFCLDKVQKLRSWIHLELTGQELPDFNQKAAPIFATLNS